MATSELTECTFSYVRHYFVHIYNCRSHHLGKCQDFEFPVLLVLLYVRVASLFYIEQVGPDQF
jgi:hypothetical protein